MPEKPADDLLRTKEAAERLRLSHRTMERWRTIGAGPRFVKLGAKSVAYRRGDLDRWLDANTHDAA